MIDLNDYLKELEAHLKTGGAREHTYRPATERLLQVLAMFRPLTIKPEPNTAQPISCSIKNLTSTLF